MRRGEARRGGARRGEARRGEGVRARQYATDREPTLKLRRWQGRIPYLAGEVGHKVRVAEVGRRGLYPLLKLREDREGARVEAQVGVGHDEAVAVPRVMGSGQWWAMVGGGRWVVRELVVVGGAWLVVGGAWLVVGGAWLVVGGGSMASSWVVEWRLRATYSPRTQSVRWRMYSWVSVTSSFWRSEGVSEAPRDSRLFSSSRTLRWG